MRVKYEGNWVKPVKPGKPANPGRKFSIVDSQFSTKVRREDPVIGIPPSPKRFVGQVG